jgi:hypothetical protein
MASVSDSVDPFGERSRENPLLIGTVIAAELLYLNLVRRSTKDVLRNHCFTSVRIDGHECRNGYAECSLKGQRNSSIDQAVRDRHWTHLRTYTASGRFSPHHPLWGPDCRLAFAGKRHRHCLGCYQMAACSCRALASSCDHVLFCSQFEESDVALGNAGFGSGRFASGCRVYWIADLCPLFGQH